MSIFYEQQLRDYIAGNGIAAEQIVFDDSCHSVADAMRATGAPAEAIVKNVCMIDAQQRLIVAIVLGPDRVSTSRVGKLLVTDPPRMATGEEVLACTGYPAGGVPSFGFSARVLVDSRVIQQSEVYTGGGSSRALVRVSSALLVQASRAMVARIRK